MVVKKSRSGMGQGLFAAAGIGKGELIAEYTGTKIPTSVADVSKSRYLFEVDEEWTIDGSARNNIARYINHSCDPNAEAEIQDGGIFISSIWTIPKGDEISIDYGDEYFEEFIRPKGCGCGAKNCRSSKS